MVKFNKKKLPSRHTSLGADRAPHRSFYYAMGETEKDVAKPFVGVVSTWNEAAPCNIALMRQAQSVKKGVRANGGTPREFCTITVTDGIAMGHEGMKASLISREVIADSAELTVRGHCYDALVGIALFLTHLAKSGKPVSHLKASYPGYIISKNKMELTPEIDVDYILEKLKDKYKNQPVNVIDGVKIEFDTEWVHLRKSNTEPIIRIYAEGSTLSVADSLANKIKSDIRELLS